MRLAHALELVLAIGVGLGFAHYRATGPEFAEFYQTRFAEMQDMADSFLAGVALIGGLEVLTERLRGKYSSPW